MRTTGRRIRISFAVIAAGALLGLAGALLAFKLGMGGPVASTGDDLAAGGARVATGPFRAVEGTLQRVGLMWNAAGRVQALEAENRDLRVWRELAGRLAERNERYEALLRMPPDAFGAGADLRDAIAAQLVMDSGGPFTRTLVANAGAEHGVRVGFIALNEHGLVGRVVSVGTHSSRVLLLDDYNSRIPVMGAQSRVRALLRGEASNPPNLLTRPVEAASPRLDFFSQGLREGETIITSGDGGLFPRGLKVGAATRDRDGQWRVALAASQQAIDFVRLAPYEPQDAPERSSEAPAADTPVAAATPANAAETQTTTPAPRPQTAAPAAAPGPLATAEAAANEPAPRPTLASAPGQPPKPRAEPQRAGQPRLGQ
ncbi:MAG: rod shape-determining protein MreC [Hyphomonadaceae bacterium]|nr:rod shape-determining protein MreC [Hyphomonadaceae bacterium]